jgi:restriction endonuclease S subunit
MKEGWDTKPFEDCIDRVTYTQKIQRKEFLEDGAYPIVSQEEDFVNGYWDKETDLFKVTTPVVIFGDHTKVLKYVDFDFVLGADGVKILKSQEFLLPKFFFYQLHTANLKSLGYARHYRLLKELEIIYPSIPEQQRIVAKLDEAFDGIAMAKANAEKNLKNARAIFESELNAIFTKKGEGWEETTLEKVLAVQPQNGWSPPAANHSDTGTPVLTLSSVTGFRFRPDKIKFTSAPTDARRNYWIKNGDFLITRSNTPDLVGHVAIASDIHKPTIYPDLIMRMSPAPDRMLSEFLYYQMRSQALRKEITGRAHGANPTMKKISNMNEAETRAEHIDPALRSRRAGASSRAAAFGASTRSRSAASKGRAARQAAHGGLRAGVSQHEARP